MKIKYLLLSTLLSLAVSFSAYAQNPGADYIALGEIKLAKEYFSKTMQQNPGEAYYYLGEIAYKEGKFGEAKENYEKGLAANPESALCAVGLAKLELKSDPKAAKNKLNDIQKKNKKDIHVVLAIAKAFYDNKMDEDGAKKFEDALKIDKKSPWPYLFEGDLLAAQAKPGDAAQQYDQAINFDPNCVIAYMKSALIYEGINPNASIDLLKKVIEIRPDYKIAYRYLGRIYTVTGMYTDAIAAYKVLFEGGDYTIEDLKHYVRASYFSQQFDLAKTLLKEGLAKEPNDFILNRLSMYAYNDTEDYVSGLATAQKFFGLPKAADVNYIVQDYMVYGNLLSENNQKKDAIEQYKKAIEVDSTKIELNKEIANICANENMFEDAAAFYKEYISKVGENAEASDYFQLGRYYLSAGSDLYRDSIPEVKAKGESLLKEADASFAIVTERIPDSYLGYYWRASVNSMLDPELKAGLAKPFYEETIKVIMAKNEAETRTSILATAYEYLSVYFYYQYDTNKDAASKAETISYCEKLLSVKPDHTMAQQILAALKQ